MHLVFVILNSFLYSIRLLHRNHKPHDRKCQGMRYTYTPYHAPNGNTKLPSNRNVKPCACTVSVIPCAERKYQASVKQKRQTMRPRCQRQTMRRTKTPYTRPRRQRHTMRRTEIPSFRQTETSNHAPAPHGLPLTHRTKLRTKKTGRQPARADCLS